MAYVRKKGKQLVVVHGARDPETRKVEQKSLFTLYSRAEALAAIGERSWEFRSILEQDNPGIRFDWEKIEAGIRGGLDHLPDLYHYKKERVEDGFRAALCALTRELSLADPQTLVSSARLLQANRHELTYLRDLIDWRLELCDQEDSEWNQDNPFYWRTAAQRREVPPQEWEKLSELYDQGKHDEAEALARLLTECWPNFAEGFNYLGYIATERAQYEKAIEHFDQAIDAGRKLFPKRIGKDMWWSDHDTRPYIRALIHKGQTLNRLGDYVGALSLFERLEKECHQDIAAATERVAVYLNTDQVDQARKAARYASAIYPWLRLPLAFALFEMGKKTEALEAWMHGVVQFPRAARILMGLDTDAPTDADEARDHNAGIAMLRDLAAYLISTTEEFDAFFTTALEAETTKFMLDEYAEAKRRWREERGGDRIWYDTQRHMETEAYARGSAARVAAELGW